MSETNRRVVIYEGYPADDTYRELALEGAVAAGWDALVFDNPRIAVDSMDTKTNAVVTGLGSTPPLEGGRLPGLVVIEKSNKLGIPRALLTARDDAERFVRPDSLDIVIGKDKPLEISERLTTWLLGLLQER